MALPSVAEREAFIRAYAASKGIDPDTAVRVARGEGLAEGVYQSNVQQPYGRERSYGDFQLHVAPKGHTPGMGNAFVNKTHMDPSDPANWQAVDRFGLDQAAAGGWSPWMGAKAQGITGFMGIGGQPAHPAPSAEWAPGAGTSMGGYAEGPHAVASRMPNGGLLSPDQNPMQSGTAAYNPWTALSQISQDVAAQSQPTADGMPPPTSQVLMPLRRIQLGKGLLG
jgi:hypothetical protein